MGMVILCVIRMNKPFELQKKMKIFTTMTNWKLLTINRTKPLLDTYHQVFPNQKTQIERSRENSQSELSCPILFKIYWNREKYISLELLYLWLWVNEKYILYFLYRFHFYFDCNIKDSFNSMRYEKKFVLFFLLNF